MAKAALQIDGQKGMNSQIAHEAQRAGWTKATYQRKNLDTNNHYDWSRRRLNFAVKDGKIIPLSAEEKTEQAYLKRMAALGAKEYKAGASNTPYTHAILIIGGNREVMRRLAFGTQDVAYDLTRDNSHIVRQQSIEEWAIDCYKWAVSEFGAENILACDVHLDESNPHIHMDVMPTSMKATRGRRSTRKTKKFKEQIDFKAHFGTTKNDKARGLMSRSQAFTEMHDRFHEAVGRKWGLDRGDKSSRPHLTKTDYIDLQQIEQDERHKAEQKAAKDAKVSAANAITAIGQTITSKLGLNKAENELKRLKADYPKEMDEKAREAHEKGISEGRAAAYKEVLDTSRLHFTDGKEHTPKDIGEVLKDYHDEYNKLLKNLQVLIEKDKDKGMRALAEKVMEGVRKGYLDNDEPMVLTKHTSETGMEMTVVTEKPYTRRTIKSLFDKLCEARLANKGTDLTAIKMHRQIVAYSLAIHCLCGLNPTQMKTVDEMLDQFAKDFKVEEQEEAKQERNRAIQDEEEQDYGYWHHRR